MNVSLRSFATVVQDSDDDEQASAVAELAVEVPPRRKRGRPRGAKTATTREDGPLQTVDFYFMRAVVEGIEPKKAADRYLAQRGGMDHRSAVAHEKHLRRAMQRAAKLLTDVAEAQRKIDVVIAPVQVESIGPSLEQFATRFDPDMYSESELIELYEEEYGKVPTDGDAGAGRGTDIKSKLRSLWWLQDQLATRPIAGEPVENWIDRRIADQVRKKGVLTLADLVNWINLTGRRWYDHVSGVGRGRAQRLLVFLLQNEQSIGHRLSDRVRLPLAAEYLLDPEPSPAFRATSTALIQPSPAPQCDVVQCFGIVPLDSLAWPVSLLGADGMFRSQGANTYHATNDREAINEWFSQLSEKPQTTQDSYRRAVERLVLWAVVERGMALSSLGTGEFGAFRDFLRNPPAHWCSRFPVMRYSAEWRPLRGAMGEASVRQTMSAIATLFADLLSCGYLRANAVASVKSGKHKAFQMDVMRSFADEDLASIRSTLNEMRDGPSKRRLRAILLLLQTSGLRRSEAAALTWGKLERARLNQQISNEWAVTFTGKGNKERTVPIKAETVQALQDHFDDRMALIAKRQLPYSHMSKDETPLLSVIDERYTVSDQGSGDMAHDAPRSGNPTGALSSGRVHGLLKALFKRVAARDDLPEGRADFLKASAHWLRHTFAHQALAASERDLPAVQQILGHKDIGTTGIYVKADLAARVAATRGVKAAF
jgi:site-specific recombinase XerD